MRRALPIALAVVVFLALSGATARVLSGTSAERERVLDRVETQAAGAPIEVLRLDVSSRFPVSTRAGFARVVWRRESGGLPVVQCVPVRREGVLAGSGVSVGAPRTLTDPEGGCGS